MSSLQIPGHASVNVQICDGPNATPVPLVLRDGNAHQVLVFGGLSKMEQIMALLLAGDAAIQGDPIDAVDISRAADLAGQIIAEAAKRANALPQRNGDGMI